MISSKYGVASFKVMKRKDREFTNEIKALSKLKRGWDYADGDTISEDVIRYACFVFKHFENPHFKYSVTPLSSGGIKLTAMYDEDFIDINVNPDFTLDLEIEHGIGAKYDVIYEQEKVSFNDIQIQIKKLLIKSCYSSEPYLFTNMIVSSADSPAIVSPITEEEYPSLTLNVQEKLHHPFAGTYLNFTTM